MITSSSNTVGPMIKGIEAASAPRVTNLGSIIKEGSLSDLDKQSATGLPGIILGKELAMILGVVTGDEIKIISPFGTMTPAGMVPRASRFQVVGIFGSGMYEYDSPLAYVSLAQAQSFFNQPDVATEIEVTVEDIYRVKQLSLKMQRSGSTSIAQSGRKTRRCRGGGHRPLGF